MYIRCNLCYVVSFKRLRDNVRVYLHSPNAGFSSTQVGSVSKRCAFFYSMESVTFVITKTEQGVTNCMK